MARNASADEKQQQDATVQQMGSPEPSADDALEATSTCSSHDLEGFEVPESTPPSSEHASPKSTPENAKSKAVGLERETNPEDVSSEDILASSSSLICA